MNDKIFACPNCGRILAQVKDRVFSCENISTKGTKIVCPKCGFVTDYDITEITNGAVWLIDCKDITIKNLIIV